MRYVLVFFWLGGCSEYTLEGDSSPPPPAVQDWSPIPGGADLFQELPPSSDGLGGVTGIICTPDGEGVVIGATVWVDVGSDRIETLTDTEGRFVLSGLPVGVHEIIAEKGSFETSFEVLIQADIELELAEEECLSGEIDIAVISGEFDSIEDVLLDMGLVYDLYPGMWDHTATDLLRDPAALGEYDVVMINCDMMLEWAAHWYEVSTNLEAFVADGGSLYVSDWAFYVLESTFPDMIDFVGNDMDGFEVATGPAVTVEAHVVDSVFAAALGASHTEVEFDQAGWVVPESLGTGVAMVQAEVTVETWFDGEVTLTSPLVVRLDHGLGAAFYTSFHNEAQVSDDVSVLLKQIVESL